MQPEGDSDAIHCWERLAVVDEFRAKLRSVSKPEGFYFNSNSLKNNIGRLMDKQMKSDEFVGKKFF